MAFYDGLFEKLGLSEWCSEGGSTAPMSMADLLAQNTGEATKGEFFPFPSLSGYLPQRHGSSWFLFWLRSLGSRRAPKV